MLRVLSLIVALLTLASLAAHLLDYYVVADDFLVREVIESLVRLFAVGREANIPTWYSSATLCFSSALLAVIAIATSRSGGPYVTHWRALAVIFLYLSLDDGVVIHEMAVKPLRLIFHAAGWLEGGWGGMLYGWGGLLYYTWVLPGAVCVVGFTMAYVRFLLHLPARIRWLFTMAGTIFVGGAIGFDSLAGQYASQYGDAGIGYHALTAVEELLEMLGVVVFVYALLEYMRSDLRIVEVHIESLESRPRGAST